MLIAERFRLDGEVALSILEWATVSDPSAGYRVTEGMKDLVSGDASFVLQNSTYDMEYRPS